MSTRQKDFAERLFWTLALAGVSFGLVYLADAPEPWALALLAVLQILKNVIAQQVGDPETSGFTDTQAPIAEPLPAQGIPDPDLEDDLDLSDHEGIE